MAEQRVEIFLERTIPQFISTTNTTFGEASQRIKEDSNTEKALIQAIIGVSKC